MPTSFLNSVAEGNQLHAFGRVGRLTAETSCAGRVESRGHSQRKPMMPIHFEPIRAIELSEIRAARERIAGTIVRTPVVRLAAGPGSADIRLKLETLPIIR